MSGLAVLGAGAWGTALANVLARDERAVTLVARDPEAAAEMQARRENVRRLPGVALAPSVRVTADPDALAGADTILAVVPTQKLRDALRAARPYGNAPTLVLCAKGIERNTGAFPADIARDEWPNASLAVLSGPSFAADVARGLPTAVTLAAEDAREAERLCALIGGKTFRPYASTDLRGVEIGGAGKNVLAIACGVAAGLALGASANAALTARGFAELNRFGRALGERPETLMGLSGLGDLLLTCGSAQSRNFSLGLASGGGARPAEALAEGAWTAPVLLDIARAHGVDMPIAASVEAVLAGRCDVARAVAGLLERPFRAEI